ncbi:CD3324 family protein [Paenibacillus sp.]|uniref:CD3324 family protein n=1 Tax=Paenibacillus sp. TaxID=58172 RepID=UPI0028120EE1|nr:CD3324 family protein [Paenibacillus sp.]
MKYENAIEILPKELSREVQKYAAGKLLYIPSGEGKRAWGEASGYREQLQRRNRMIRNKYAHGRTVSELADEYFLSLDSIKKIFYSKKQDSHAYAATIESALKYANDGMLEEWMNCYWQLSRTATAGSLDCDLNQLYFGIVKLPLRLIQRDELDIGDAYANEADNHGSVLPPLIVEYNQGKFHCTEQRGILAGLKQRKVNSYPAIIVLRESTDYSRFMDHFGTVLFFVN